MTTAAATTSSPTAMSTYLNSLFMFDLLAR